MFEVVPDVVDGAEVLLECVLCSEQVYRHAVQVHRSALCRYLCSSTHMPINLVHSFAT